MLIGKIVASAPESISAITRLCDFDAELESAQQASKG
jgi:hypothetical protein